MTTIGNHQNGVTLNPSHPTVTITGQLTGDSLVPGISYINPVTRQTITLNFYAAVQGTASIAFDVVNLGDIDSRGTQTLDTGIFLIAAGTIINHGTIEGGTGIEIFGKSGIAYIDNTALLDGRTGDGAYLRATACIANNGTIRSDYDALYLRGGGTITNSGFIDGNVDGIVLISSGAVNNTGTIKGTDTAIDMSEGGTISNAGTIIGGKSAIFGHPPLPIAA